MSQISSSNFNYSAMQIQGILNQTCSSGICGMPHWSNFGHAEQPVSESHDGHFSAKCKLFLSKLVNHLFVISNF